MPRGFFGGSRFVAVSNVPDVNDPCYVLKIASYLNQKGRSTPSETDYLREPLAMEIGETRPTV